MYFEYSSFRWELLKLKSKVLAFELYEKCYWSCLILVWTAYQIQYSCRWGKYLMQRGEAKCLSCKELAYPWFYRRHPCYACTLALHFSQDPAVRKLQYLPNPFPFPLACHSIFLKPMKLLFVCVEYLFFILLPIFRGVPFGTWIWTRDRLEKGSGQRKLRCWSDRVASQKFCLSQTHRNLWTSLARRMDWGKLLLQTGGAHLGSLWYSSLGFCRTRWKHSTLEAKMEEMCLKVLYHCTS